MVVGAGVLTTAQMITKVLSELSVYAPFLSISFPFLAYTGPLRSLVCAMHFVL